MPTRSDTAAGHLRLSSQRDQLVSRHPVAEIVCPSVPLYYALQKNVQSTYEKQSKTVLKTVLISYSPKTIIKKKK